VKLTRIEETELVKKIEAGRNAQAALDKGISSDDAKDMRLAAEGREAKGFFIESNIGLVHFVANTFYRDKLRAAQNAAHAGHATAQIASLTYDDLVQEGTLGLMNALEKFDWRKGHKFSSLAWWHIRMRMQRANQNTGRTIRLPSYLHARIQKINTSKQVLYNHFYREPTIDEIAAASGFTRDQVKFAIDKGSMRTVAEDTLDWGHKSDEETAKTHRALEMDDVRREIDELLQELEPLQRQVLIHRFGLDNGEPRTLEKISDALGISSDAVLQVQAKAMRKMRRPNQLWRVKKLTRWINDVYE
jgi:RNA polymerase primary sigma factor